MANSLLKVCEIPRTKGAILTVPTNLEYDVYGFTLQNNQALSGNNVNLYVAGAGGSAAPNSGIFRVLADNFTGYAQVASATTSSTITQQFPVSIRLGAGDAIHADASLTGTTAIIYGKVVR